MPGEYPGDLLVRESPRPTDCAFHGAIPMSQADCLRGAHLTPQSSGQGRVFALASAFPARGLDRENGVIRLSPAGNRSCQIQENSGEG
jgi:hypothetical protein